MSTTLAGKLLDNLANLTKHGVSAQSHKI